SQQGEASRESPVGRVERDVLRDLPLPAIAVREQAFLVVVELLACLGRELEVRSQDDGVDRAGLLAEAAVDAFHHVDVIAGGPPRAVVAPRPRVQRCLRLGSAAEDIDQVHRTCYREGRPQGRLSYFQPPASAWPFNFQKALLRSIQAPANMGYRCYSNLRKAPSCSRLPALVPSLRNIRSI